MKNKLFAFLLMLGMVGFIYSPGEVKAADSHSNKVDLAAAKDVRYVKVRGKRYKVWYSTYYKKGKRYVRISKIRRA